MTLLDRVARDCLRGQTPPDDLRRFWKAHATKPWNDVVAFTLAEKVVGEFFRGYRVSDGVSPEVAKAYQRMFEHIAFVGSREDGELVGYWLGPENRAATDSPIVELDTEGQFHLRGRNLAEYLLACVHSEDDFQRLRQILAKLGFRVTVESHAKLLDSFDVLESDFGNPNRISWRYQKGQNAPPPSTLLFGTYEFPRAAEILHELGIDSITADSTKKQVIKLLGEPNESGGDKTVPVLGYIYPWIKYQRADCQLRFAFEKGKTVKVVTLIEPDWEPGM